MTTVSAADANRHFSQLLQQVKAGATVTVTSRGKPVARIEPVREEQGDEAVRRKAWKDHFSCMRAQPALNLGRIVRDEIYED